MRGSTLISVVDDNESIRDSTRTLLRSAGYDVATFESGELFLESGALRKTGCLILDIRMPGMDGLELQRLVKISDSDLPVIFVTAHDDKTNRKLALDSGASDFFRKPFRANEFLIAVDAAVRGRGCPDEIEAPLRNPRWPQTPGEIKFRWAKIRAAN